MVNYNQVKKVVRKMTNQDKQIGNRLLETFNALPDNKKEYLIGFAEGVAAMSESKQDE